jgi:hypothetical protein
MTSDAQSRISLLTIQDLGKFHDMQWTGKFMLFGKQYMECKFLKVPLSGPRNHKRPELAIPGGYINGGAIR